jgi:uncharacterized protein YndB with AHSA1/START domain
VNATLQTADGRLVLRFERRLAHRVEKVWRAITEPAELSGWFPADMEFDLAPRGKIHFVFREGEGPTQDGVITELEPGRVFAYTWGDAVLRFELRPDGEGCLLVFTHTFDERPSAASFAAGWTICLGRLEAVLDGRKPASEASEASDASEASEASAAPDGWAGLHQRYLHEFGLDEGTVQRSADGWVVRFERQLTRPIEAVWAALTGADAAPPATADVADVADVAVGDPAPRRVTNAFVPAGAVTAVQRPTTLETEWLLDGKQAGRVCWELTEGNGGARLTLTQTVPAELADRRPVALAAWHTQLDLLADHLSGRTRPWPEGRTEELTRHYADLTG